LSRRINGGGREAVFFMRGGRRSCHWSWGFIAIIAGIVIILALILPAEFWWFMLAAALIAAGIWYMRSC
jgi:uncharacterized membrane protein HdeD (DUF308 family)